MTPSYQKTEETSQHNQPNKARIVKGYIQQGVWQVGLQGRDSNLLKAAGAQNDQDRSNQTFMTSDSSNMTETDNYQRRLTERRDYKLCMLVVYEGRQAASPNSIRIHC